MKKMKKSPFRQQVSEYDCFPTTFVNALSYLFERNEIPAIVVQRIYLYCLDIVSSDKSIVHGTSRLAIQFLGDWFNAFEHNKFKLCAKYRSGDDVHLGKGSEIAKCLNKGGVALLRVKYQKRYDHYILGLEIKKDGWLYAYDPYAPILNKSEQYEFLKEVELDKSKSDKIQDKIHKPNLKIKLEWLDANSNEKFQLGCLGLGDEQGRECLLLSRKKEK